MRNYLPYVVLAAAIGAFVCMYYQSLNSYALRDWDESIYAQVALQSHDAFGFQWLGSGAQSPENLWHEKPPLVIWLVQISFALFGVGEFGARATMPVFAAGIILLTFLWAKLLTGSRWAGVLAAALFGACYHFLLAAGILSFDIPIAFFILLSVYAYAQVRKGNTAWWYVFWVGVGLGVLTKSVIGLFPVVIAGLDMAYCREWRALKAKELVRGALVFLLLTVPWHAVETIRYGAEFWRVYLGHHVLSRFATGVDNNLQPWWWYSIIFTQLPYAVFAALGVVYGGWHAMRKKATGYGLPLLSFVVLFVVLSISKTKGSNYIVVVYPFLNVAAAVAVYELISLIRIQWVKGVVWALLLVGCVYTAVQFNPYRLVRMKSPVYENVKQLGQLIKAQYAEKQVQYVSLPTPEFIIAGRPAVVFYSGQYVTEQAELPAAVRAMPPAHRTPTHQLYVTEDTVYVVAVRYVP